MLFKSTRAVLCPVYFSTEACRECPEGPHLVQIFISLAWPTQVDLSILILMDFGSEALILRNSSIPYTGRGKAKLYGREPWDELGVTVGEPELGVARSSV